MTRQDTSAIVDSVMADVIGGGFQHDEPAEDRSQKPEAAHDNAHL